MPSPTIALGIRVHTVRVLSDFISLVVVYPKWNHILAVTGEALFTKEYTRSAALLDLFLCHTLLYTLEHEEGLKPSRSGFADRRLITWLLMRCWNARKGLNLRLLPSEGSALNPLSYGRMFLERARRIELLCGTWQAPVLPLYYTRLCSGRPLRT
jgi:hypothetical protein